MLTNIITSRGVMRAVILGLCVLFVCGNPAAAAWVPRLSEPGDRAARAAAATPSAAQTMAAYKAAEPWIRAWVVPAADAIDAELHRTLSGISAVNITLRLNGALIGRGESVGAISGEQRNAAELLRSAAAEAIEQSTPKLNLPNDATRDEALHLVTRDVTISIELAGPFTLTEPETWGDVDGTWKPGLDGVAVSAGKTMAMPELMFPSAMLAANIIPSRAMSSVSARVIGEGGAAAALEEPKTLREKHGLRTYRFRVTHLAQASAASAPEFLHRGARLVPAGGAMRGGELEIFAADLADHLLRRVYAPSDAAAIGVQDQLLAAYAMASYVKQQNVWSSNEGRMVTRIETLIHENELKGPAAPAFVVLADRAIWRSPKGRSWLTGTRARAAFWNVAYGEEAWARAAFSESDQKRADLIQIQELPPVLQPVVLLATFNIGEPKREWLEHANGLIRTMYAKVPDEQLVAMMPWLGWADRELTLTRVQYVQEDNNIGGAIALRRMREQCWKHQLSLENGATSGDDADMLGGITFALADGKQAPYPTWHCAKPLAFIATMLGDPRLTEPRERTREIARLMSALRYLRQLQVDESSAWMYANPSAAMGGIRASVWDNTQPVEATAYTLLCVVEMLKSLDALAAEQAAGASQSLPGKPAETPDSAPPKQRP